jgi:hypothetical protein
MTSPAFRRRDHMLLGEVVDNVDPEGLGRVRVFIGGVLEPESVWALPIGAMLGNKNLKEGVFRVPEKGANVCVWLNQGDTDAPYYAPGPWGGGTLPDETLGGNPDVDVFRWRDFVFVVDGRAGQEKVFFKDRSTSSQFMFERATGNFTRLVQGTQGDEVATVKRNLQTTVQTGSETRTIAAGSRTTTIAQNDSKTVTGNESNTVGGARTDSITGNATETVGGNSTETITLGKILSALLAVAITAGTNIVLTAGAAINLVAASISLASSGPSTMASTGLMTQTFLGGIVTTIVGAVAWTVTGAVVETVSGLWTMVVNGGLLIQGAAIQVGTGSGGYKKLLNASFLTLIHLTHTHPLPGGGGNTGTPNTPSAPDVAASETADLTAS